MISSPVLLLLFVGAISATPVVQDDWKDIVKAGAEVAGNAAKVAIDIAKIVGDVGRKRETQDDWKDIASAGGEVLTNAANVAIDVVKIIGDIKGKRAVQDDLADVVAAIEAKVKEVVEGALNVIGAVESKQVSQREVQDTNWGSLVVDGAAAVKDVVDLGESIGHLVSAIKG
ncbi:hypothetical protein BsWGS_16881 [Bradybaena similaris]